MMRFSPEIRYVSGKSQITADALSRATTSKPSAADSQTIEAVEEFARDTINLLPASTRKLHEIAKAQDDDEVCALVKGYCRDGWPSYIHHTTSVQPYFDNQARLTIHDGLLLYEDRIVIPKNMRLELLDIIHRGHLGITKCRARAKEAVWWPGMSSSIEEMVKNCTKCAKVRPTPTEPLMPSSFPSRPWERVGMDLFELDGSTYLIVVCYRSRWPEVRKLTRTTTTGVIHALKGIFAVHGIPELVISDNGPQFASSEFKNFAHTYNFNHVTSSPNYPAANGEAERCIKTVKEIFKKNNDPYLGLLTYRTTPLQNGLSPAELLMGRKLRTQLPMLPSKLENRSLNNTQKIDEREKRYRENQAEYFNRRHKAALLPQLRRGDDVWVRDQDRDGVVVGQHSNPRSYLIKTENGVVRRNRAALVKTTTPMADPIENPSKEEQNTEAEPQNIEAQPQLRRSGRITRRPVRLIEE